MCLSCLQEQALVNVCGDLSESLDDNLLKVQQFYANSIYFSRFIHSDGVHRVDDKQNKYQHKLYVCIGMCIFRCVNCFFNLRNNKVEQLRQGAAILHSAILTHLQSKTTCKTYVNIPF